MDQQSMEWKTEFATGIHNIDHQHKEIVEIITLYEKISEDETRWHEAHPLVLRTRDFMEFHFSVEDSLMRLLPYPDCDAHRAEHQRVLQHIADIERRMLRENMHDRLAPMMRHCLFGHIVAGDKHLAQYALGLFGQRSPASGTAGAVGVAERCK
jgi:hemerythrin